VLLVFLARGLIAMKCSGGKVSLKTPAKNSTICNHYNCTFLGIFEKDGFFLGFYPPPTDIVSNI
jgi:hypothetical protein